MPPRKATYRRREAAARPAAGKPPTASALKTSGVAGADVIRVLKVAGSGLYRDGMTVGEFLSGVPSRDAGLRQLVRSQKSGTIGFEHGGGVS